MENDMETETYSIDQGGGKSSCNIHREVAPTTTTTHQGEPVVNQYYYAVRHITPIEGERLQGFADNWTRPCFTPEQITDELVDRFITIHQNWAAINGKPNAKPKTRKWVREWLLKISSVDCPDGPRYKAIGNSMSTKVMNWIGQRINEEDTL